MRLTAPRLTGPPTQRSVCRWGGERRARWRASVATELPLLRRLEEAFRRPNGACRAAPPPTFGVPATRDLGELLNVFQVGMIDAGVRAEVEQVRYPNERVTACALSAIASWVDRGLEHVPPNRGTIGRRDSD